MHLGRLRNVWNILHGEQSNINHALSKPEKETFRQPFFPISHPFFSFSYFLFHFKEGKCQFPFPRQKQKWNQPAEFKTIWATRSYICQSCRKIGVKIKGECDPRLSGKKGLLGLFLFFANFLLNGKWQLSLPCKMKMHTTFILNYDASDAHEWVKIRAKARSS